MGLHVLFGGIPGSGKSTFICSVYEVLRQQGEDASLHEIDVWSDTHQCILGQKPWQQRNKRGSKVVGDLFDEYVDAITGFSKDDHDIVLGDLPGVIENPGHIYLAGLADYAVLVTRELTTADESGRFRQRNEDWVTLFRSLAIPIGLRIHTLLGNQTSEAVLVIDGLCRRLRCEHPVVHQVATVIANSVY